MRRSLKSIIAVTSLVLLAAGAVLAKPGTPKGTQGAYDLIFAIDYTGTGNAAVAAKSVTIVGHVVDNRTGQKGTLVASHLSLDEGRFHGTGRVFGATVNISGRVEAADGAVVKNPRLFCNFSTSSGAYGRVLGQRKGA